MKPADRPMGFAEREALFDRVDAFLARRWPARPEEPPRVAYDCPDCGHPGELFRRHYRYGPGGVDYCPRCGWEEPPF